MSTQKVHLIGIGGSAMSNLAVMFAEAGWKVSGSDNRVYPPASTTLASHGIAFFEGYDPQHIKQDLDLVVVGNVVSRNNIEARVAVEKKLAYKSMPGALYDIFMRDKKCIAICGTHGKTTTTSLMSWVYNQSQCEPSFFVGGVPKNFKQGYGLGKGEHFVIEGDEYDTAYFEKTPKFLHYHPEHVVITSIEFDHADIYRDFAHVYEQFEKLVAQIPADGSLIACTDHPAVKKVARGFKTAISYGKNQADWTYGNQKDESYGQSFDVLYRKKKIIRANTYLLGEHSRLNILSVVAQASVHGLDMGSVARAIESFTGVKKRQERIGERQGIVVYEDFAHHPSAIATTIQGFLPLCRARKGRLLVALEPRSNTMRRSFFEDRLIGSFQGSDMVFINKVFQKKDQLQKSEMLNPDKIVKALQGNQVEAFAPNDTEQLINMIVEKVRVNDVVVFMSNGDFQQASQKLLHRLSV